MFARFRKAGCPCQESIDPTTDEADRPIITLVHGTWAQHTWVERKGKKRPSQESASELLRRVQSDTPTQTLPPQTADLFESLRRRIPNALIYRFCWSGGNSNTKRLKAALELRAYLAQLFEKHPKGQHFLIGHSHGGTVSLYALKDPDVRRRLTGVITLATPFLHFNRRRFPGYILYWNAAILLLSLIVMVTGLLDVSDNGVVITAIQAGRPWWWLATTVVTASLVGVGAIVGSAWLYRGAEFSPLSLFRLRDETAIDAELERLRLPDVDADQLYVVRGPGDEAAGGLASAQFLFSWLITRLLGYLSIKRLLSAWRSMVVLLLTATLVLNALNVFQGAGNFLASVAAASLFVVALGGGVFAALGLLILVLGGLPFAWDAGFLGLVAQTTAEPMPRGSVSVYQLGEPAREGLAHSIQNRITVHDLIEHWIEEKVGVRQQLAHLRADELLSVDTGGEGQSAV